MGTVLAVFWLLSGDPAYDYLDADQCHALQVMTEHSGGVDIELSDGQVLRATRMECRQVEVVDAHR